MIECMDESVCVCVCVRARRNANAYLAQGNQNGRVATGAQGWVQNLSILLFLLLVWMGITHKKSIAVVNFSRCQD